MQDASPSPSRAEGSTSASTARLGPRIVALLIDWAVCSLIAYALLHYRWGEPNGSEGFKPLLVFAIENIALVSTLGFTFGQRIMRLQVQRIAGGPPGFLAGVTRTLLLLLVIPALITDGSGRGLHDRAAGTVTYDIR